MDDRLKKQQEKRGIMPVRITLTNGYYFDILVDKTEELDINQCSGYALVKIEGLLDYIHDVQIEEKK